MEFLTTWDVARRLDVSPATVRNWERLGKLIALRTPGGIRLFDAVQIDKLLEQQRAEASEQAR